MPLTRYDIKCLNTARELINKNPARHYTIPEIAALVYMSPSKLKTAFKKLFNMGLYKYLQQERLEKGKFLLDNTDKTLEDISRSLGYKFKNNFSVSFKKKFGCSPHDYKNK